VSGAQKARWCENASELTGTTWRYLKIPQKEFQALQPTKLADLKALQTVTLL